jgi:hypothetical protein
MNMGKSYTELEALSPTDYLNKTDWDARNPAREQQQYQEGLDYSNKAHTVFINYKSVWGADMLDGSMVTSYEGIGYHAHTSSLLRGFLAGPARIVVQRWRDGIVETEIKPSTR